MKKWDRGADLLWKQGKHKDALSRLSTIVKHSNSHQKRSAIFQLVHYLLALRHYKTAIATLSLHIANFPHDAEALNIRAVALTRLGQYSNALADCQLILQINPTVVTAWEGLAVNASQLNQWAMATSAGEKALMLKDEHSKHFKTRAHSTATPAVTTREWERDRFGQNVIAFSVLRNNPKHLRGAVHNLIEISKLYSEWIPRFYVDRSIPDGFSQLVQDFGGQVVLEDESQSPRQKRYRHLNVIHDPTVRRFLIRTVDAVVSVREAEAVNQWIGSDRCFHIMRDWWSHLELVPLGMWGGYAGVMGDLSDRISEAAKPTRTGFWKHNQETTIQDFLWGVMQNSCLIHDRFYRVFDAVPWPNPTPPQNSYVGQHEYEVRRSQQAKVLKDFINQFSWLRLSDSSPKATTRVRQKDPTPTDFASKVRWRMKYDRNPLLITVQDKYTVRDYAKSKGVKTSELLYVTDRPETIPFTELPPKCMIKANHGCGWNILRYDSKLYQFGSGDTLIDGHGDLLDNPDSRRQEIREAQAIQLCNHWLTQRYVKREWAYQHIPPKIIVEEYLNAPDNQDLKDYRLYTFHGVVKAISMGSALYRREGINIFFDLEWNEFKLTKYKEKRPDPLPQKPACLTEMIDAAQRLGEDIDFARIDFYDTSRGIILGEMTVYPEAGFPNSPTACTAFNKWLGAQWHLKPSSITSSC
ncbi:MAG: ATP-grasp fold amidoligase family protein [Cyanobacteria bacterium P01_E01_bin.45]